MRVQRESRGDGEGATVAKGVKSTAVKRSGGGRGTGSAGRQTLQMVASGAMGVGCARCTCSAGNIASGRSTGSVKSVGS